MRECVWYMYYRTQAAEQAFIFFNVNLNSCLTEIELTISKTNVQIVLQQLGMNNQSMCLTPLDVRPSADFPFTFIASHNE